MTTRMEMGIASFDSSDSVARTDAARRRVMDYTAYARQMVAYYDNPSNDARKTPAHKWARHYRKEFETEGTWLREIARAAQEAARGRRVLELACGHCRWTPFIAEVAQSVLATDAAPNMLEWGQRVLACATTDVGNVQLLLA